MKTVYPPKSETFRTHAEWRKWLLTKAGGLSAEEQFEADFFRIWNKYKQSIINARTKKA